MIPTPELFHTWLVWSGECQCQEFWRIPVVDTGGPRLSADWIWGPGFPRPLFLPDFTIRDSAWQRVEILLRQRLWMLSGSVAPLLPQRCRLHRNATRRISNKNPLVFAAANIDHFLCSCLQIAKLDILTAETVWGYWCWWVTQCWTHIPIPASLLTYHYKKLLTLERSLWHAT